MAEKETTLKITEKKDGDFMEWYTQVVQKAELADYSIVSGCMVLRPRSYAIWEKIQDAMNTKMKKLGVRNAYFPLLIPEKLLMKEAEHVEGFSPEVAWVTSSGSEEFAERLAIRPTSETIMYDSYAKWIRSHRDLPLRLNQWCSVVRWEFKHPTLFLRTREFLWQEGHTAFAEKKDAEQEVNNVIDMYASILKDYLALPALRGKKTDKEKFAGAEYTVTLELLMPNGKAIQGPDAHHLGQHFSKAFDIKFTDSEGKEQYVWQNSWGLTTRMIGILIGIHSDDKGLVLPPRIAENKVVIVPILFEKDKDKVMNVAKEVEKKLIDYDVVLDDRDTYTPGFKFHDWELKGIPLRIEIGPKDVEKGKVVIVRRDSGDKIDVPLEKVEEKVEELLEAMHETMYQNAHAFLHSNIVKVTDKKALKKALDTKKIALIPLHKDPVVEDELKAEMAGAKTLNIPFDQPKEKATCIQSGKPASFWVYFGRSY